MIEKLKTHSAKVGARGVIMSPSRELALQTLKVVKELGRGTDLRTILLVGGDSLEERTYKTDRTVITLADRIVEFSSMTTNPDIIIATPGRFLHLKVEMGLDLSSVQYIVFDEADRLFEMGFAAQLAEILYALPTSRQTLLFSATLPKSLVEFARAGLQEPKLIRLDAESKISPDLKSAYFTIKSGDRDGALLHLLDNVIKVPFGETEAAKQAKEDAEKGSNSKKRKRHSANPKDAPVEESTIIFAATKHRVEYLSSLLRAAGYAVSYGMFCTSDRFIYANLYSIRKP
jgi:ATP-dependent RNA helicase DDX54/DBP10